MRLFARVLVARLVVSDALSTAASPRGRLRVPPGRLLVVGYHELFAYAQLYCSQFSKRARHVAIPLTSIVSALRLVQLQCAH